MNFRILTLHYLETPIGTLAVGTHHGKLKICDWIQSQHFHNHCKALDDLDTDSEYAEYVIGQLREYFAGKRSRFDVEIEPEGTPFRRRVWKQLYGIQYGDTASYSDIAGKMGMPSNTARCVANAISQNPINIIIPCHRIIGRAGSLTGYAGGIEAKKMLLSLENSYKSMINKYC